MIGGFRSDMSITPKTDGNFENVSAGVLFCKVGCKESHPNSATAKTISKMRPIISHKRGNSFKD